jgi:hypothetical protein
MSNFLSMNQELKGQLAGNRKSFYTQKNIQNVKNESKDDPIVPIQVYGRLCWKGQHKNATNCQKRSQYHFLKHNKKATGHTRPQGKKGSCG